MSLFKKITKAVSNIGDKVTDVVKDVFSDPVGSVLSPVTNTVGELLNNATGVTDQMEKSYEQQKLAMALQNEYNVNMWNLANEYNTPASQLARMKEAGIDVNPLAYAMGSSNLSNTAGVVSSGSGFAGHGSLAGNPLTMAMGVASGLQGIKESKTRQALNHENAINAMIHGQNMMNQGVHTRLQNDIMRHNLEIARTTGRPVGYVPSMYSDPFGYGKSVGNDLFESF